MGGFKGLRHIKSCLELRPPPKSPSLYSQAAQVRASLYFQPRPSCTRLDSANACRRNAHFPCQSIRIGELRRETSTNLQSLLLIEPRFRIPRLVSIVPCMKLTAEAPLPDKNGMTTHEKITVGVSVAAALVAGVFSYLSYRAAEKSGEVSQKSVEVSQKALEVSQKALALSEKAEQRKAENLDVVADTEAVCALRYRPNTNGLATLNMCWVVTVTNSSEDTTALKYVGVSRREGAWPTESGKFEEVSEDFQGIIPAQLATIPRPQIAPGETKKFVVRWKTSVRLVNIDTPQTPNFHSDSQDDPLTLTKLYQGYRPDADKICSIFGAGKANQTRPWIPHGSSGPNRFSCESTYHLMMKTVGGHEFTAPLPIEWNGF